MVLHLNSQTDLEDAIHMLVQQDPRLKPVLERTGMPALRRREPGFAGLAAIITGQQLSTASAAAIWARVSAAFDPFDHARLRKARADRLGRLGLSAAKIRTLKNLARELAAERLNLEVLANEDADAAHNTLTALHGIGPWTAHYIAMRASRWPVCPATGRLAYGPASVVSGWACWSASREARRCRHDRAAKPIHQEATVRRSCGSGDGFRALSREVSSSRQSRRDVSSGSP